MSISTDLRRLVDAIERGEIEAPSLLMVARIYYAADGSKERTALDYFDTDRPGHPARWATPHAPAGRGPMTIVDDGA